MLKSTNKLLAVADAEMTFACDGNASPTSCMEEFAEGCTRRIERGDEYITRLRWIPEQGLFPGTFDVVSRHCAHCALTYLPAVTVYVEESCLDTMNAQ